MLKSEELSTVGYETLRAKQLEKELKMQSKELIKSQKDLVATHCTRGAAEDSETVALEEEEEITAIQSEFMDLTWL